jgi:uncharacterized membrane protein (DUF106 family)
MKHSFLVYKEQTMPFSLTSIVLGVTVILVVSLLVRVGQLEKELKRTQKFIDELNTVRVETALKMHRFPKE